MQCVWRLSSGSGSAAVAAAWPAAQAAAAAAGPRSLGAAALAARRSPPLQQPITSSGRRSLHTSSTLRSDDSGDSSSSSSLSHAPAVSLGYSSSTTSGAVSATLLAAQGVQVGGAGGAIPKQKVKMYNKMLRVVRSPVKGDVPNTQGQAQHREQPECARPPLLCGRHAAAAHRAASMLTALCLLVLPQCLLLLLPLQVTTTFSGRTRASRWRPSFPV